MTLHLTLPADLEERLRQEAERSGQGQETVALRVLDEHLPPALDARRAAAVALLQRWAEEDASLSVEEMPAHGQHLASASDEEVKLWDAPQR